MNFSIVGPGYQGISTDINSGRCINFIPMLNSDDSKSISSLVGTPGLSLWKDTGDDIIRGAHSFNNLIYVVIADELFSINSAGTVSTALGTLTTTTGRVTMSDNGLKPTGGNQLIIVDGVETYIYDVSAFAWTAYSLPEQHRWTNVVWNGYIFCAVGYNTQSSITSSDGITWSLHYGGITSAKKWVSLAWNGTVFCCISEDVNGTYAMTSTDGITWTDRAIPAAGASAGWTSITARQEYNSSAGTFLAVTLNNTLSITSTDGITWSSDTNLYSSGNANACCTSPSLNGSLGKFVVIYYGTNRSYASTDGINWTQGTLPSASGWFSVVYNGTIFLTVGGGAICATSTDGINWTSRNMPSSKTWNAVTWNGSVFIATAYGEYVYATSPDGITWTSRNITVSGNNQWSSITTSAFNDPKITLTVSGGVITAASIVYGGRFYYFAPNLDVTDSVGAGTGAKLTATVSNGTIIGITIDDGGSGYTAATCKAAYYNYSPRVVAHSANHAIVSLNGYGFDGTNFERIYPRTSAYTVDFIGGYFVMDIGGGQYRISELYDGTRYNALNMSTADAFTDNLLAVKNNHNELWLFGENSIEIWYQSGTGNPPFARVSGGVLDYGCAARYSVAKGINTIFWLANINNNGSGEFRGVAMANGYAVQIISTEPINYQISQYATISDAIGYTYSENGHDFYVLTFPTVSKTWVYDLTTNLWHERSMWGGQSIIGQSISTYRHLSDGYVYFNGKNLVYSYLDGKIYEISQVYYDDAGLPIVSTRIATLKTNTFKNLLMPKFQADLEGGTYTSNPFIKFLISTDNNGDSFAFTGDFVYTLALTGNISTDMQTLLTAINTGTYGSGRACFVDENDKTKGIYWKSGSISIAITGTSTYLNSVPHVEISFSYSKDGGHTFCYPSSKSLASFGYGDRLIWYRNGSARQWVLNVTVAGNFKKVLLSSDIELIEAAR